ncbi:MAG: hypothetical protein ACM34L_00275 [Gemmatimonas sp.]
MTARERVRRAQYRMLGGVALSALLWGAVLAMTVVSLAAGANAFVPLSAAAREIIIPLMIVSAAGGAGLVLWRGRAARSIERVAMWIEEREPSLNYVLVTAIDEVLAPLEQNRALHAAANGTDIDAIVRHAWQHSLGRAAIACVVLGAVLAVLGPGDLLRAAERELADRAMPAAPAPMPNRLLSLRARVAPPVYTRLPAQVIEEPSNVAALVGSRITLEGNGAASGIVAALGTRELSAMTGERGWAITETMPPDPTVLTLRDRGYRRLLALEPRADSAPAVRLHLPARDTTYQHVPKGKLEIDAALSDDIGLDYGYVEYLLSSGSEESFETKLVVGEHEPFANARAARLHATLDLDTLKLSPGSVIHIRVVAYDYNDVTGPGKGVSETRTLKIAEPVDSTSINAAPPLPIDSMWISQRLLNMRTDTLTRSRRALSHEEFAHRSSAYSNGQEDIRKRALAVIALLEDNGVGDAFQTDASKMLRQAVELMWTAREDLGVTQPDSALPIMKKILKILDDLRLANRYYLRGILKPVAVNIERTRLTGKDSARAQARTPRGELDDPRRALAARIDAAVALARNSPSAAADSLVYIRVSALTSAPTLAVALEHAIDLLRHGTTADSALARARRALEPPARVLESASDWGGLVP